MNSAHIITIGNEILIGDTVNTNASWIGSRFTEWGFQVDRAITIADRYEAIQNFIEKSLNEADLTVVTGGLGPTHDDVTKRAVADLLNLDLMEDKSVLKHIRNIFEKRGFTMSQANREQALIPEGSSVLFNKKGTAPGIWLNREGHCLILLPGVPHEMKHLMNKRVAEKIPEVFPKTRQIVTEYYKTASIPESTLSEKIGDLDEYTTNGVEVAFLPGADGVTIRISADSEEKLSQLRENLYDRAGDYIYGKGKNRTLSEVVGELLSEQGLSISTAESCTGGYVSHLITNTPGSSDYMIGGVVSYANQAKMKTLGVSKDDLEREGAVSKTVALQMAKGVAELYQTDIGISTTGIAGPTGGTEEKPVGLVWMGFYINGEHFALRGIFTKDRLLNKKRSAMVVLDCIRRKLSNSEGYPYELKPHSP